MSIFDKIIRFLSSGYQGHSDPEPEGVPDEPEKYDPEITVPREKPTEVNQPDHPAETTEEPAPQGPKEDMEITERVFSEAEVEKMMTDDRIKVEVRMDSDKSLRAYADCPMTLGKYLKVKHFISSNDIAAVFAVVDDNSGKCITSLEDPANYDLLSDLAPIDRTNSQNKSALPKRNVTLDITLRGAAKMRGTSRMIINMSAKGNFAGRGEDVTPAELTADDYAFGVVKMSYMTFKEEKVERGVNHFTYERFNTHQVASKIAELKQSATDKTGTNQPLTDRERLATDTPRLPAEMRRAEDMMRHQRWTDAIAVLTKVYETLRVQLLLRDEHRAKDMMLQVVIALYKCHMALDNHDLALFYGELSAWLEGHPNKLLTEAMRKIGDIRVLAFPPQADNDPTKDLEGGGPKGRKRFSLILDSVYGLRPSDLSNMLIIKDGDYNAPEKITDPSDIWALDVLARMKECDTLTTYISIRGSSSSSSSSSRSGVSSDDKSTDTSDNVLIAVFNKVTVDSRQCVMMSLLLPVSIYADDYDYRAVMGADLLFTTTKALDMPLFLDISEEAAKKAHNDEQLSDIEYMAHGNMTEARYNMVLGATASDRQLWGDVLYYLIKSYRLMAWSALLGAPDVNAEDAIYNLCFKIGYAYCDLRLFSHAISYLARAAHVPYIPYQIEYINALCNSGDIRALEVIEDRMKNFPEKLEKQPAPQVNTFMKFLKRRYAYMLVESKRIKEAREYLHKLLSDEHEETRRFAQQELEYINDKYPD